MIIYMIQVREKGLGNYDKLDLSARMCNSDITAGVALLRKFSSEELVQFSAEHAICDKLSLFADLRGHFQGNCIFY
jgi:hypothetical protein